ncbi:Bacterial virulence factor haemolysin [Serratia fonticola]|uniref:Bacterial virulence factor haemolysin n=1 Tax=Serratia fonticola TaxID=47917 RepID=A0A4U9UJF6_SERFO|nr:Bacterial virulence factor haemolysin [Serratia fonticola]
MRSRYWYIPVPHSQVVNRDSRMTALKESLMAKAKLKFRLHRTAIILICLALLVLFDARCLLF